MSKIVCPFCGGSWESHGGASCPVLDSSLARIVRAAVAAIEADRSEKAKQLALNTSITPLVFGLDNAAGSGQKILGYNENRGAAMGRLVSQAKKLLGSGAIFSENSAGSGATTGSTMFQSIKSAPLVPA